MVDWKTQTSDYLVHAGGGTALVLINLSALIPGLFPVLALTAAATVILLAPFAILGLAAAVLAAPFYLASRLVKRARRRRRREQQPPTPSLADPIPYISWE
jgi:membrane protein implicated in regulation of membrane protease activity